MQEFYAGVPFTLVNTGTEQLLMLIVCNVTLGYPGGYQTGVALRTPELSILKCAIATRVLLGFFLRPPHALTGLSIVKEP